MGGTRCAIFEMLIICSLFKQNPYFFGILKMFVYKNNTDLRDAKYFLIYCFYTQVFDIENVENMEIS